MTAIKATRATSPAGIVARGTKMRDGLQRGHMHVTSMPAIGRILQLEFPVALIRGAPGFEYLYRAVQRMIELVIDVGF